MRNSLHLELSGEGERLHIGYGEKTIIDHRPEKPVLTLAKGEGRFRSWHANYKIRDKTADIRHFTSFSAEEEDEERVVLRCKDEKGVEGPLLIFSIATQPKTGGEEVEISLSELEEGINRVWLRLSSNSDEHIYGCGEQYSALDLRGRRVPLWVQEQGIGRGKNFTTLLADLHSHAGGAWYTTYFPQTSFVSSAGWYCVAETYKYAEFDFLSSSQHTLHLWEPAKVRIGVATSFADAHTALNKVQGLQPRLPEWVYDGILLGVQGGGKEIERKLGDAKNAGVQVGGLWTQDWEGKRVTPFGKQLMWNWRYAEDQYPHLPDQIKDLKKRGVRFLGYINPFLAVEEELYKEASEKGYCVQHPEGGDYLITVTSFPAALLDLSNPDAFEWIKKVIKQNMIGIGMAGWMCDYGEYLPTDAVLYSGEDPEEYHNKYPVEWARANREAVEEAGVSEETVFFMRAGHNYATKYAPAHWAGDQMVDWSLPDGLASAITAGLSLGFSGVANFHSDIGGFTSLFYIKRKKELLLRWLEFAAFTPIMRSHESNRPDKCWQFNADEETLAHFAKMTKIFTALKPYHIALGEEYVNTGETPIRHPALAYEDDEELHNHRYQYLYGNHLFVAPVYRKGRKGRTLYLPDDRWIHLWSGKEYGRGIHKVQAPIGRPPVFYRAESEWADLFASLREIS